MSALACWKANSVLKIGCVVLSCVLSWTITDTCGLDWKQRKQERDLWLLNKIAFLCTQWNRQFASESDCVLFCSCCRKRASSNLEVAMVRLLLSRSLKDTSKAMCASNLYSKYFCALKMYFLHWMFGLTIL